MLGAGKRVRDPPHGHVDTWVQISQDATQGLNGVLRVVPWTVSSPDAGFIGPEMSAR